MSLKQLLGTESRAWSLQKKSKKKKERVTWGWQSCWVFYSSTVLQSFGSDISKWLDAFFQSYKEQEKDK